MEKSIYIEIRHNVGAIQSLEEQKEMSNSYICLNGSLTFQLFQLKEFVINKNKQIADLIEISVIFSQFKPSFMVSTK